MKTITTCIFAVLAVALGPIAQKSEAAVIYFDVNWSGAPNGNSATATALIGIDTSDIPNPGSYWGMPSWFDSITITISGATSGNGTFVKSDFSSIVWDTAGGTLDFDSELVGQPTSGQPWASNTSGTAGDFNIFRASGSPTAPEGTGPFQITPSGSSDTLNLVSFQIPEPTTVTALIVGGFALVLSFNRRRFREA